MMNFMNDVMNKIFALCKRRGFIFQGSDIYGGFQGFWDYGPLGVELKNNIKREWWKNIVHKRENVVGLDAAIIMNPKVWEVSGHVDAFTDLLIDCQECKKRFRIDEIGLEKLINDKGVISIKNEGDFPECPTGGHKFKPLISKEKPEGAKEVTPRKFNLLIEVLIGVVEPRIKAYLRGEITQGVFVNFRNVIDSTRVKIPFGIAQIGKAFRNEITPGNFTFRSREFEQMELEFFIKPNDGEGKKWFEYWKNERMNWYLSLGLKKENLKFREHKPEERAHYAKFAEDIEFNAPFGWSEFEGIHHRGDWDLSRHKLSYKDEETGEEFTPWVIESSGGVDRAALFILIDAYCEEENPSTGSISSLQAGSGRGRIVLKLNPKLAPVKVAVFPLLANKPDLVEMAGNVYKDLQKEIDGVLKFDDRGNIGKRYLSQDEIGTPFCVTIDFQSLEDQTLTVRDRDTTKQERVKVEDLADFLRKALN